MVNVALVALKTHVKMNAAYKDITHIYQNVDPQELDNEDQPFGNDQSFGDWRESIHQCDKQFARIKTKNNENCIGDNFKREIQYYNAPGC
jgi:hypothetical protein